MRRRAADCSCCARRCPLPISRPPLSSSLSPLAEPRLEVGPVGTYTDYFLECMGGRARCPNLALASMGYQCQNGEASVSSVGRAGLRAVLAVGGWLCALPWLSGAAGLPPSRSHSPVWPICPARSRQLTACCATAKAHDCQPVYKIEDKRPKNWKG